jgi:hypothetical protein
VPACLIICRATRVVPLPSFISVAVGVAADMRVSGPLQYQHPAVNGGRLQRLRAFSSRFTLVCHSYFATSIPTALVLLV